MTAHDLKQARLRLGLTQKGFAALLGTTRRTYQDWEYGITAVPGPVVRLVYLLLEQKGAADLIRQKWRE